MFTKKSYPIIDSTFKEVDIFLINSFPYELAAHDIGSSFDNLINEIRYRWLYSRTGFMNQIMDYKFLFKRLMEFVLNVDYPKSLRQRTNIVHEMMKSNFNSNVPVHITTCIRKESKLTEATIDAEDINSGHNFSWIIHPGQTRAQASVFCRRNLSNVLLYIPKSQSHKIKFKNFKSIEKIDTHEKLYKLYSPLKKIDGQNYIVDLSFGREDRDIINDQKVHRHNGIDPMPILKATYIYDQKDDLMTGGKNKHPGTNYVISSFNSFNKFCEIFHNNQYVVYTTLKKLSKLWKCFERNESKLATLVNEKRIIPNKKVLDLLEVDSYSSNPKNPFPKSLQKYFEGDSIKNWLKKFDIFLNKNNEIFEYEKNKNYEERSYSLNNLPIINIDETLDFFIIPELNNYRGFALFLGDIDLDSFFRTPIEMLYFISGDVSIVKSKDEKVAIINCEHEYWKTKKNYKEYILTDNVYYEG